MPGARRIALLTLAIAGVWSQHPAQAQIQGSFDGSLTGKKITQPVAVAAVLAQVEKAISGTVALPADLATYGGDYLVQGKATAKRIKVSGRGGTGAVFRWNAKITGSILKGNAKLKAPGTKALAGSLTMTENAFTSDGSSCDNVYHANQAFFVDQVLGKAMLICGTCHAPGLQAAATRLHVDATNPLATARLVALCVDSANPPASRILQKPLNLIPHGGGAQLVSGSPEELILEQWVNLVAQAHCE